VIASTITVMVDFLPLFLIQGLAGQMFIQFARVVIFAIAVSLLDALTVVPMLASRLIKEEEVEEVADEYDGRSRAAGNGRREGRSRSGARRRGPLTGAFDWFGARFHALYSSYHRGLGWAIHHRA